MNKTNKIVLAGVFAAVLAVISQLSIPMPGGVPVTIQVFAVALTGTVLGWGTGVMAVLVYILLGAVGLPIFANFQGGLGVLLGYAGGYIAGWPFMALLCGIRPKTGDAKVNFAIRVILALIGLMIVELFGGLWWAHLAGSQIVAIMIYSFGAFIPKDIVITVLGVLLGIQIRQRLKL